jgi:hypothetical protein
VLRASVELRHACHLLGKWLVLTETGFGAPGEG